MTYGTRIKQAREDLRLTQEQPDFTAMTKS